MINDIDIIYEFTQYKFLAENAKLDDSIINHIKNLTKLDFNTAIISKNKKEKLNYKLNLILNKLSFNNRNEILLEFMKTFYNIELVDFDELLRYLYLRSIKDITFMKEYVFLIKNIFYIYNKLYNYNINYLIDCLELTFIFFYKKNKCTNIKYNFIYSIEIDENTRINFLSLIYEIYKNNIVLVELIDYCTSTILIQESYILDIYYWSNIIGLTKDIKNSISKILENNKNLSLREYTLLKSMI